MKCYLIELREGRPEVFVQYRDEWTEENAAGRARREPGRIPANLLAALRPVAACELRNLLGRDIDWLPEPPPEPIVRKAGREAGALWAALALWALRVFLYSVLSFWVIGILYCGAGAYWAGRLAGLVLEKRGRRGRPPDEQRKLISARRRVLDPTEIEPTEMGPSDGRR